MKLENSVIAITGGGGGLGFAMARRFAAGGAKLALIDHNADLLASASKSLATLGAEVQTFATDITDEAQVEDTFKAIADHFGHLNGLVNNAGIIRDGLLVKIEDGKVIKKMSLDNWQMVINVNLMGVFLCGREAAGIMAVGHQPGCILNISSIAAKGNMGQTNYSATKAGVLAMTVTWAKELGKYGIRCAAIAPGFVSTPILEGMKQSALEKLIKRVPLERLAQPEEVAQAAQFIFENDYFTGRVLELDGGLRI